MSILSHNNKQGGPGVLGILILKKLGSLGPSFAVFKFPGPKTLLGLFCNTLQISAFWAQSLSKQKIIFWAHFISRLLRVKNLFWAHLGLGLSLTEAQQPLRNPRIRVWASDRPSWPPEAAHGGGRPRRAAEGRLWPRDGWGC